MSRELKFRAWDEEMKEYFYSDKPDDVHFFEFKDGKLTAFAIREPRQGSDPMEPPGPYCDEYPVEQYIGLKDKNGKEIYEGDRVRGNPCTCPPHKGEIECEIGFDSDNGGYEPFTEYTVPSQCNYDACGGCRLYPSGVEIIGTIHDKDSQCTEPK